MATDPSSERVFRRADLQYLAHALSEGTSHGGLDIYDLSLGVTTTGNKSERSAAILRNIFDSPDADERLLRVLDDLYLVRSGADFRMRTEEYRSLEERVLKPRGIARTDDGYQFMDAPPAPAPASSRAPGGATAATTTAASANRVPHGGAPLPVTAATPAAQNTAASTVSANTSHSVFVVHGRDMRPVEVLRTYLGFLGLRVMPWSEAVSLTGKTQPHTYDIVKAGIEHSAAVIVIFSPDDEAKVRNDLAKGPDDPDLKPRGQARQNVTLEAGLAFGIAADKTIFVKSAPTREISDIDGFNWVKLDGEFDSRRDLKKRLEAAGAALRPMDDNLADKSAGPFQVL